ncbi:MAG: hypothetical protein ABIA02_03380 [Candidatus Falkowbacteria bacterium]
MENRKKIGILIIAVGLIFLAVIIYFMFFVGGSEEVIVPEVNEQDDKVIEIKDQPKVVFEAKEFSKEEVEQIDLRRISINFAERFGSYSNQSDFGNIRDSKVFMSEKMKKWADDFISSSREQKGDSTIYNGMVTKAISQEVKSFTDNSGEILVSAQRKEIKDSGENIFYQDILIKFIQEEGEWKVDDAKWQ